jgi:hypothetical protein
MIALLCFLLTLLVSPFKSNARLEVVEWGGHFLPDAPETLAHLIANSVSAESEVSQ